MQTKQIDLKQVLGVVAEYDSHQELVSPQKPFEVKAAFYPGAASTIHIHPHQDEYYKVHQGEIELYLNGKWKTLREGEEAFIPRNAVHGFRNRSSQVAFLTNIHTPGLYFGESLAAMENLTKRGKINGLSGFKNLVHLSQYALRYTDTTRPVKPSLFLVKLLSKTGRLFGYNI
jgi:quercetin dioxygenase-like cupin family protein